MNIGELIAFVIYFAIMLTIGFHFFKRSSGSDDKQYFLGGRSMGPWVTAMSAQASDMSGWLLMGFPGSLIAFGMGQIWIGIGLALGTIANWLIVAKRLRRFSKAAGDAITLPQYLTNRFASKSPALKIVCAVIFLISFTIYVASAFVAGETVLCSVVPWFAEGHQTVALLIFAAIILVYTFLGGFKAVCWTDFIQGLLMLAALLLVPIVMAAKGNFDSSFYSAFRDGITEFNTNPFTADWTDIVTGLAWGLGYFGMPHILVRFMAIKKPSMMKKSAVVAIIWVILSLGAAAAVAILGRTYILGSGTAMAEAILPDARKTVFIAAVTDIFPGFIAGILLAAIIAAAMSTADSQLLVASSSFTSDLYKPLIRKDKASSKELGWIGRIVVAVIAVVAYFIASSGSEWASDIMAMVENAWGLFGAAFGPVIILSLFWKRFNYAGAVTGIVVGAAVDIVWLLFLTPKTNVYEILPGFVAGLIASVVAALVTKAPSAEVEKIFADATAAGVDD
ncbi:MAG: sodium/proline symporter [Oscillospiraceae bacterium]|nr:sodium/proline symporter [Oscillospiraceae bacterium]